MKTLPETALEMFEWLLENSTDPEIKAICEDAIRRIKEGKQ